MRIFNRTCTFFRNSFSEKQNLRAYLNFPTKNIIRSFLCFPPVCFPVFTRQIARYPPRKS
ncbi:hypothetical protein DW107_08500 [Tannerella sp. AM09-19]|nr:hypothetical protein DW107_08500 [Tannerella sp. AM09-19]